MAARSNNIVLGFDFSDRAREALRRARMEAASLHVVCVVEPDRPMPASCASTDELYRAIAKVPDAELRDVPLADRFPVFVHVRVGMPAKELLAVADEVAAELIVVGSRRTGGSERAAHLSVADAVARRARCSVEIVRAATYPPPAGAALTCVPARTYAFPVATGSAR